MLHRTKACLLALSVLLAGVIVFPITSASVQAAEPRVVITNSSLIFNEGKAIITVKSLDAVVDWAVLDDQGVSLRDGEVPVNGQGVGTIDVDDLGPGLYYIDVSSGEGDAREKVRTTFGVLAELPAAATDPSSPYGIGTHFSHGTYNLNLIPIIAQLGFKHLRDGTYWAHVEKQPGVYTFDARYNYVGQAVDAGLMPLIYLAYRNGLYDGNKTPSTPEGLRAFANYANAVLDKYGSDVTAVEVYNEFNIGFNDGACGRTPACYIQLLKATSDAIRAKHPDVTVSGPAAAQAMTTWNFEAIDEGVLPYVDAYTAHPYQRPSPPEVNLPAELDALKAKIAANNTGEPMPMWISEIGWGTHIGGGTTEAQQADYSIRTHVLAQASGVERLYWYDLMEDGNDRYNQEHNYGILRRPTATVKGYAPKPAAIAQAVMMRELAGLKHTRTDQVGDGIYSYEFASGADSTRVMWSSSPKSLSLHTQAPLTITDEYGGERILTPTNGQVQLTVDNRPVFVTGAPITQIAAVAPLFSISGPEAVAAGEAPSVTVSVDGTQPGAGNLPANVTFEVDGAKVDVPVVVGKVTNATLGLSATDRLGGRSIVGHITHSGQTIGRVTASVEIVEALTVTVEPVIKALSPLDAGAAVIVENRSSAPITVSALSFTAGGHSTELAAPVQIAPRSKSTVANVAIPEAKLWEAYDFSGQVTFSDGNLVPLKGKTSFSPVESEGFQTATPIDLETQGRYRNLTGTWSGTSDLSGKVSYSYTDEFLIVNAAIVDNVHEGSDSLREIWNGDSIQFGFSERAPGFTGQSIEVGAGLLDEGPVLYSVIAAAPGPILDGEVDITHANGVTNYRLAIPWTLLSTSGKPDRPFALSLLVNDNDNDGLGRKSYVEWASGIGGSKTQTLYRAAQLIPSPCTTTITEPFSGPLTVTEGVTCVVNTSIDGPVTISAGAAFWATGATITGPVRATNSAGIRLAGSTIRGPVWVTGTDGAVVLDGATIIGPVQLTSNHGGVTVADNDVRGTLSCSGNDPAPTNGERPNTVSGRRSGQCAEL